MDNNLTEFEKVAARYFFSFRYDSNFNCYYNAGRPIFIKNSKTGEKVLLQSGMMEDAKVKAFINSSAGIDLFYKTINEQIKIRENEIEEKFALRKVIRAVIRI